MKSRIRNPKIPADEVGVSECGDVLGVDPSRLTKEAREYPGFPRRRISGRWYYHPATVRAWREQNIRTRGEYSAIPPVAIPLAQENSDAIRGLRSGESLKIQTAAVDLVGKQLANQAVIGQLVPSHLTALKQAASDLRASKMSELELAEFEGRLVDREIAKLAVGRVVSLGLEAMDRLQNSIVSAAMEWRASALEPEAFRQFVADWFSRQTTDIRNATADKADAMIEEAKSK